MHFDVLNKDQHLLIPVVNQFNKDFYMVGGTSIALHIGHRMSIDFDMFTTKTIKPKGIIEKFKKLKEEVIVTLNIHGQLNLICRNVKFTFFEYEYEIPHEVELKNFTSIPNLLDLAAMKAYALGRRSKWKDYLDLYFIIKDYYTISEISSRAVILYKDLFSEKLFKGQLCYFEGINYTEQVDFMPGFEVSEEVIKAFLIEAAISE